MCRRPRSALSFSCFISSTAVEDARGSPVHGLGEVDAGAEVGVVVTRSEDTGAGRPVDKLEVGGARAVAGTIVAGPTDVGKECLVGGPLGWTAAANVGVAVAASDKSDAARVVDA